MKVLVIVDVQKEFDKFIQHDLVSELCDYANTFDKVYQIYDGHKNATEPTYKFPKEVKCVEKLFGINHFSDEVKRFTNEIEHITEEGTTYKLSNGAYVVRVDNNHKWFYVNPEITDLINDVKNDEVIFSGGASSECLEDVIVAFKAFGVKTHLNKKYVYSEKTNNNDSVSDKEDKITEGITSSFTSTELKDIFNKEPYDFIINASNKNIGLKIENILVNILKFRWGVMDYGKTIVNNIDTEGRPLNFHINWKTKQISCSIQNFNSETLKNVLKINDDNIELFENTFNPKIPNYNPKKIIRESVDNNLYDITNYIGKENFSLRCDNINIAIQVEKILLDILGYHWCSGSRNIVEKNWLCNNMKTIIFELDKDKTIVFTYNIESSYFNWKIFKIDNSNFRFFKNLVITGIPDYSPKKIIRESIDNNLYDITNYINNNVNFSLRCVNKDIAIQVEELIITKLKYTWGNNYNNLTNYLYNSNIVENSIIFDLTIYATGTKGLTYTKDELYSAYGYTTFNIDESNIELFKRLISPIPDYSPKKLIKKNLIMILFLMII
jgi:hypothetical protein